MKNVAQDHHDHKDEEGLNVQFHSTPKSDGEGKHTRVEFNESELDVFRWQDIRIYKYDNK